MEMQFLINKLVLVNLIKTRSPTCSIYSRVAYWSRRPLACIYIGLTETKKLKWRSCQSKRNNFFKKPYIDAIVPFFPVVSEGKKTI